MLVRVMAHTVKEGGADNIETKANAPDDKHKLRLFHNCVYISRSNVDRQDATYPAQKQIAL